MNTDFHIFAGASPFRSREGRRQPPSVVGWLAAAVLHFARAGSTPAAKAASSPRLLLTCAGGGAAVPHQIGEGAVYITVDFPIPDPASAAPPQPKNMAGG